MKKKIVSVLLCVAMVATMAVGCGGKKTDGDSGSSKGGDKLFTGQCGARMSHRQR